ncbi:MAG: PIG-L family deacetylase [Roseiflexus sp.]|nr:PIG-L family deacetylase [Roseiflexus sp.]MBO9365891.1 PIG-L family deacetylase [Roseiflexus sp.]MBO9390511.1 PIG-L family deacetylase [Roseiflexus sp.]
MNVLIVAAHPDDEVLGCGGVTVRHAARGDRVYVVVVTRGFPEIFSPEIDEEDRQHAREAHEILGGAGIFFLDFPAPRLDTVPGHELADAIREVIFSVNADVVYTPFGGDLHGDHKATYLATLVASRPINNCPVRRLLCYETLSETDWASPLDDSAFKPTVFVDISEVLERKLQALACFRNELKQPPHPRSLRAIEALARVRGSTAGLMAAEAFMLVREIID